jgi:hypothetical protein
MPFLVISCEKWERMIVANGWNSVELRDNRYNQIIHMVSAANGAEDFYTTEVCIMDRKRDYMRMIHNDVITSYIKQCSFMMRNFIIVD